MQDNQDDVHQIGFDSVGNKTNPNIIKGPHHMHIAAVTKETPPLTPKTRRAMSHKMTTACEAPKRTGDLPRMCGQHSNQKFSDIEIIATNDCRHMLLSAPCPCNIESMNYENIGPNEGSLANRFVGPYKNYDIPRTSAQQVSSEVHIWKIYEYIYFMQLNTCDINSNCPDDNCYRKHCNSTIHLRAYDKL